eukprot:TRINITY_DN2384_c0_g1_i1.p1 TRINITY_DN2384_c0_g1~~TRINITY_DN2384_c0_g1_i1.p1  ORF type:complete len:413 (+),score=89.60 TRINITY_DN2384_c0_g1_i1:304-1542(+)
MKRTDIQEFGSASTVESPSSPSSSSLSSALIEVGGSFSDIMMDNENAPTNLNLFVNYLPQDVNDEALRAMFAQYGEVESCKVMIDLATGQSRCFGFVKFKIPKEAQAAVQALNGYKWGTKTLVVKSANATNTTVLGTPSNNIYIKGIPLVMSSEQLRTLFAPYGTISECKILIDPQTQMSRGMGFIRYASQQEADNSINALNGQVLPGTVKPIVVKYADTEEERQNRRVKQQKKRQQQSSRYSPYPGVEMPTTMHRTTNAYPPSAFPVYPPHTSYHPAAAAGGYLPGAPPVASAAVGHHPHHHHGGGYLGHETNLFVYHLPSDVDDALLYRLFSPYGAIESVKIIRDHSTGVCKGYGFVKMVNVADAWNAMHALANYKVGDKYLQVTFKRGGSEQRPPSATSLSSSSTSSST